MAPIRFSNLSAYKPQDYEISKNFVIAKFPYNEHALEILKQPMRDVKKDAKSADIKQRIIETISADNNITIPAIANALGITKKAAEYQINKLKERGLLSRSGSDKNGCWVINR